MRVGGDDPTTGAAAAQAFYAVGSPWRARAHKAAHCAGLAVGRWLAICIWIIFALLVLALFHVALDAALWLIRWTWGWS